MPDTNAANIASRLGNNPVMESVRAKGSDIIWAEPSGDAHIVAIARPDPDGHTVAREPLHAARLREMFPNLVPVPLGIGASAGFGDRLGLATPGHADSLRACGAEGRIGAIFAQQSMRENQRTGRNPQGVLDDATVGAFLCGWDQPVGADADHLKTTDDIDLCLAAGYSFFTVDPGDHVISEADALRGAELSEAFATRVPWARLETSESDLKAALGSLDVSLEGTPIRFDEGDLERAAVKYGGAVAHVVEMARHLVAKANHGVELEVSVDETATPTTLAEHWYVASELARLGVTWVSLAPRFVGDFEKGVDYRGDLTELSRSLRGHALIAAEFGGYKLSLHSGSDKFSVYPIADHVTDGRVHLKTAGTSYLEALRVIGTHRPELLREIAMLSRERFEEDVKTYLISGTVAGMPDPRELPGSGIAGLLDQLDARQVLHVTFGSALRQYGTDITAVLNQHAGAYRAALRRHFERHLAPFAHREAA